MILPTAPRVPPFGSAPHRILPGVWVTLGGRHLTTAGNHYWEQQFQLGATDGKGHYDHAVGAQIRRARTGATPAIRRQAGEALGARAKIQQSALQAQADLGMSIATMGASDIVDAVGKDVVRSIQHRRPTASATKALGNEWVVAPVKKAVEHPNLKNIAGAAIAAGVVLPGGRIAKPIREGVDAVRDAGLAEKAVVPGGAAAWKQAIRESLPPEEQVFAAIPAAKRGAAIKAGLISVERSKRFARAEQANKAAGGGQMGHAAAKAELRGEMATPRFDRLENLSDDQMDYLFNIVDKTPGFLTGHKLTVKEALKNARAGKNPTPGEIKLMEHAFGPDIAGEAANQQISSWRHALDIINIPRALMTGYDLSGLLRQNLGALFHSPVITTREFGKSLGYITPRVGKARFEARNAAIEADPWFHVFEEQGGKIQNLGKNVVERNEYFPSKAAEKIPGIKASGRAFTGLSNATRFEIWKKMYQGALASGAFERTKDAERLQKQIMEFSGILTGRGSLGRAEKIAPELNAVFFAPKLMSSRIKMLTWAFNKNLDPYIRRQHLQAFGLMIGAGSAILTGLAYAGFKVGLDPRSSDFGKARKGKIRIDIWGGHQPYVRVMAQILSGTAVSSTTNRHTRLWGHGAGGPFNRNVRDVVLGFASQKLSPPPGFIYAWATNSTDGGSFNARKQAAKMAWPLVAQDAWTIGHDTHSPGWGAGAYALAGLGVGLQDYPAPGTTKAKISGFKRAPVGHSNGSPDWFGGGSSGGGGTDLFGSSSGGGGTDLFAP